MSYTISLDQCSDLLFKLAAELREKYDINKGEIVTPYLEREYNIKVIYDDILDEDHRSTAIFPSEAHYTFLLLKYT